MKKIVMVLLLTCIFLTGAFGMAACNINSGGGDQTVIDTSASEEEIETIVSNAIEEITEEQSTVISEAATTITAAATISSAGDYTVTGTISGSIKVKAEGVHLFLDNCALSNTDKKVIDSDYSLIITLIGTNTVSNTGGTDVKNAIDSAGSLTVNGNGSLSINSCKSGIKSDGVFYGLGGKLIISAANHGVSADTCIITGSTITVTAAGKDAVHAESDDTVTLFSYDRGYVYIADSAKISASGIYGDGIQADTFVYITGGTIDISSLPTWVTATSKIGCYQKSGTTYTKVGADEVKTISNYWQLDASCKGIKSGEIDYDVTENGNTVTKTVASDKYAILIDGGIINISSTDDGIHTNSGDVIIKGSDLTISTSDDAVHADNNLKITGGNINITKSYEGLEGMVVEISGGTVKLTASDDGINAANSNLSTSVQKQNCKLIISGGRTYINASGDGVDSNGSILISGGELYISGPTSSGDSALDSETGIIVTGGILIAAGSSGMAESPSTSSTQYCASVTVSSQTGAISVKDGSTVLMSFSPSEIFGTSKTYQNVVISCPAFEKGNTYSLVTGSATTSVTLSSIVTNIGSSGGGAGGGPGGR